MTVPTLFLDGKVRLFGGDCRDVIRSLPDNSVDSVVTDPPYALVSIVKRFGKVALGDATDTSDRSRKGADGYARRAKGFMGKEWDNGDAAFAVEFWAEVFRVLKPGGHVAAFSGTRTYHRLACAIEDSGFEIRDQLAWTYGTGFPKSHDVSKGIDKALGLERAKVLVPGDQVRNPKATGGGKDGMDGATRPFIVKAAQAGFHEAVSDEAVSDEAVSDEAVSYQGWGTALKPAWEPIVLCSKPVTVTQHFAMIVEETSANLFEGFRWLNVDANDAENRLIDTLAKCGEAACSVLDNARMRSLASIGIVRSAARSSTFSALASIDQIETRVSSVLSHVAPNGNVDGNSGQTTQAGWAEDISTRLMGMSTSVMAEGISANTARLWANISADLLREANKFTIETATKLTIALKILNCSLPRITFDATGNLSPNWEPIVLARKPLSEKTVAANVLRWGTGALNIDGCRVGAAKVAIVEVKGRWPANVLHDGSMEVLAGFPDSAGAQGVVSGNEPSGAGGGVSMGLMGRVASLPTRGDAGSAARFFYSAKADADDRIGSKHPTVKPVDLMQWLVRLITPNGGVTLDPFAGTGTTGEAAWRERFSAILIEREAEYQSDIARRMEYALSGPDTRKHAIIKAKGKTAAAGPLFGDSGIIDAGGGRAVYGEFPRDGQPGRPASKYE